MIAEGVAGRQIGTAGRAGALLGQADDGHLRLGEDDFGEQAIVHLLHPVRVGRVVCGDLALLDRNMDNLV